MSNPSSERILRTRGKRPEQCSEGINSAHSVHRPRVTLGRMNPLDPRSALDYVADAIRSKIESGELGPGQKLPSFDQMASDYMVSVSTLRNAVEQLKGRGLIITRQGKGTFVRERPTARRHGIDRYA